MYVYGERCSEIFSSDKGRFAIVVPGTDCSFFPGTLTVWRPRLTLFLARRPWNYRGIEFSNGVYLLDGSQLTICLRISVSLTA